MHQAIVNNEKILQSTPKINSKCNDYVYTINLYGRNDNLSEKIHNYFPVNLDCGDVDIVSLNNNIVMMIRNIGHALSIEIEKEKNKYYVKYFI